MIKILQFKKIYPGNTDPVLHIDHFEISKGIYWLHGSNGSGKTSLIKSMAGLVPFEGNIEVYGKNIFRHRLEYTKAVNYAEAEPLYPPFLTGNELIRFYRATKGELFPEELYIKLGVDKFAAQKTSTYSSGMMKKLSLVLAFIGEPSLILLDEPLIALDSASTVILQQHINTCYGKGIGFLLTSHQDLSTALLTGTQSLFIKNKTLSITA
ncbi:MAG: ATP-binding cassette domain-containing protein [Ferruginibacter sp.]